jgi:hypothetical protein
MTQRSRGLTTGVSYATGDLDDPESGDDVRPEIFPVLDIHDEALRYLVPNPTIEYLGADGWCVTDPEYRGCMGTGVSQTAALDDFYVALRDWLSLSAYKGIDVPEAAGRLMNGAQAR